jgi:biopolymer transport protein ExbD
MGASALPGSDDGGDEADIVAEINVTPLTDIFLVLLIIFMVTTSVIQDEGKNIELPSADVSEETPQGVTVSMDKEGNIRVNDNIVGSGELEAALEFAIEKAEQKVVILRGDRRVLLGQAVNILDLAQKAGAKSIAIATQQADDDSS